MYRYGKTTQNAIAVMSRLAQAHGTPPEWLTSHEIARARNLTKPLVTKLLNALARGGLVEGTPGPRGGYRLARRPEDITLLDVVRLFEREEDELGCAFGPGWCGRSPAKCPLHDQLTDLRERLATYLSRTHFGVFQPDNGGPEDGRIPQEALPADGPRARSGPLGADVPAAPRVKAPSRRGRGG